MAPAPTARGKWPPDLPPSRGYVRSRQGPWRRATQKTTSKDTMTTCAAVYGPLGATGGGTGVEKVKCSTGSARRPGIGHNPVAPAIAWDFWARTMQQSEHPAELLTVAGGRDAEIRVGQSLCGFFRRFACDGRSTSSPGTRLFILWITPDVDWRKRSHKSISTKPPTNPTMTKIVNTVKMRFDGISVASRATRNETAAEKQKNTEIEKEAGRRTGFKNAEFVIRYLV